MTWPWDKVKKQISRDDMGKHDIVVEPESVRWLTPDGAFLLEADGEGPYSLSEWAECQLCARLGIPVKYFRNCPGELKKMQVEYLIKHRSEKRMRWRLRLKGNRIRGLVSGSYQPFDDSTVASVWESIGQCERFRYESLLDDTSFFLRAIAPNGEDGSDGLGGLLTGFYIRNSEVGRSGISAGPIVYRLICSNGLVVAQDRKALLYKRHIWIDEAAIAEMLNYAVAGAINLSHKTTEMMAEARKKPMSLDALVQRLDNLELTEQLRQQTLDAFIADGNHNAFGVVNALTSTARGLPPHERYELERSAGKILAEVA
jgi:hypothetical protein